MTLPANCPKQGGLLKQLTFQSAIISPMSVEKSKPLTPSSTDKKLFPWYVPAGQFMGNVYVDIHCLPDHIKRPLLARRPLQEGETMTVYRGAYVAQGAEIEGYIPFTFAKFDQAGELLKEATYIGVRLTEPIYREN